MGNKMASQMLKVLCAFAWIYGVLGSEPTSQSLLEARQGYPAQQSLLSGGLAGNQFSINPFLSSGSSPVLPALLGGQGLLNEQDAINRIGILGLNNGLQGLRVNNGLGLELALNNRLLQAQALRGGLGLNRAALGLAPGLQGLGINRGLGSPLHGSGLTSALGRGTGGGLSSSLKDLVTVATLLGIDDLDSASSEKSYNRLSQDNHLSFQTHGHIRRNSPLQSNGDNDELATLIKRLNLGHPTHSPTAFGAATPLPLSRGPAFNAGLIPSGHLVHKTGLAPSEVPQLQSLHGNEQGIQTMKFPDFTTQGVTQTDSRAASNSYPVGLQSLSSTHGALVPDLNDSSENLFDLLELYSRGRSSSDKENHYRRSQPTLSDQFRFPTSR